MAWFDSSLLVIRAAKEHVFEVLVSDMSKLAHQLEKITPKHEHIINDKSFVQHLVKKHLVNNKDRQNMTNLTISSYVQMQQVGAMGKKLGIDVPKDPESPFQKALPHARATYDDANQVVTITAAATIVLAKPP